MGDLFERNIFSAICIHIDIQIAQIIDLLPATGVISNHDGNCFVAFSELRYGNSRQASLQTGCQRRAVQSQRPCFVLIDFQHCHWTFLKPIKYHAGHRRILGHRLSDFFRQFLYLFMLFADYPQHDREGGRRPVGQHLCIQSHVGKLRYPFALHLIAQAVARRRPISQYDQLAIVIRRHRTVLHQDEPWCGLRHITGYIQNIGFFLQQVGNSLDFPVSCVNRCTCRQS